MINYIVARYKSTDQTNQKPKIPRNHFWRLSLFFQLCVMIIPILLSNQRPSLIKTDSISIPNQGFAERVMSDLVSSKWMILAGEGIGVLVAFIWILMMRFMASVMVWASLIGNFLVVLLLKKDLSVLSMSRTNFRKQHKK